MSVQNTLNPIPGLTHDQAVKLIQSFSAQKIACCKDQEAPEEGPIEIQLPAVSDYRAIMERTSRDLIGTAGEEAEASSVRVLVPRWTCGTQGFYWRATGPFEFQPARTKEAREASRALFPASSKAGCRDNHLLGE